jgi:hypothetical protein
MVEVVAASVAQALVVQVLRVEEVLNLDHLLLP